MHRIFVSLIVLSAIVLAAASGEARTLKMVFWYPGEAGGRAVAEMVGGRRVDPQTTDLKERQLLNIVEEMAIASSVPMPSVYILPDEEGINAFAAGLTTSDAVVAVRRPA